VAIRDSLTGINQFEVRFDYLISVNIAPVVLTETGEYIHNLPFNTDAYGACMQNHHPLVNEFPEHKDKIHQLKVNNNHFRRLAFEYEGVDKAIVRAEQGIDALDDSYLETLKKERLSLKDILFGMLKTA